ncbi:MAG: SGNH/GDSL hydrolase family protein [Bacteroidaceae bacterium]
MNNYICRTFLFTLLTFAGLVGLHFLPSISIDGHQLRKVDLFADLRPEELDTLDTDTIALPPPVKPAFVDTCRTGLTCIEDYADSTKRGMSAFYQALGETKEITRSVRIAVFGDSFIEADILTGDLREMFQSHYGGCGVGFVPITSQTSGYRSTVNHNFGGWMSHAVTDTARFDRSKQGISGHYFIPQPGAYVEARGQSKFGTHLDTCEIATLYFAAKGEVNIQSTINKKFIGNHYFEADSVMKLSRAQVKGRIGRIRWTIEKADTSLFYGFAMDGQHGVAVDNFSLRGSSGLSLRSIPTKRLAAFNRQRPYDLIILQYGLNIATERGKDYSAYKKGMLTVIAHLKECFPQASILVLSIGDRDYKTETGELRTMPGVRNLVRYQQAIAAESHVAFWNLFTAMGGNESMAKLVHAKPSMANYDYTHINFRGGKHIANMLFETLDYGKKQYEKRKEYDK